MFVILILFILASFGLTQILVHGRIFDSIRPQHHFFHCTMCVGFWVGMLIALPAVLIGFGPLFSFTLVEKIFSIFIAGCISSGTSYALCGIFSDDGININLK